MLVIAPHSVDEALFNKVVDVFSIFFDIGLGSFSVFGTTRLKLANSQNLLIGWNQSRTSRKEATHTLNAV